MFASRFSSSVSRCSCIALLRSGEKASQKSLPQRLNHGNDRAVSDNDRPGGHRIHKIQNSSSDLLPIATEGTDLQLAGTRSSGQGCEVNSESFGQNDLHRGREGNTGWSPIASSRKR